MDNNCKDRIILKYGSSYVIMFDFYDCQKDVEKVVLMELDSDHWSKYLLTVAYKYKSVA